MRLPGWYRRHRFIRKTVKARLALVDSIIMQDQIANRKTATPRQLIRLANTSIRLERLNHGRPVFQPWANDNPKMIAILTKSRNQFRGLVVE